MNTASSDTRDAAILSCPACGRHNRVPRTRLKDSPVCGACKTPLLSTSPLAATDSTFETLVLKSTLPVLVDFWAPWCGPCRAIAPALDQIAAERSGVLRVVKVNVDECPRTAARHQVQAVPTLLLFQEGTLIDEVKGAAPKPAIDARIDLALSGRSGRA